MNKNINNQINRALGDYKEIVWVYSKSSNSLGSNYDPYRNVGYVETLQSPIPIEAIVHQISDNGLIQKELGLSVTGAIEILVNDVDKELILNASKFKYKDKYYTTFHKALGGRMLMSERPFGMTRFMCFREGNS